MYQMIQLVLKNKRKQEFKSYFFTQIPGADLYMQFHLPLIHLSHFNNSL